VIELDQVTFGYRRGTPVIDGWTGTVSAGECVAVVGRSGAGKSTLLYLIGMLIRPWAGRVRLLGREVDGLADGARSSLRGRHIGFVFQDALLDPRRSVLDNITEGTVYRGDDLRYARKRALSLLDSVGVDVEPSRRATDLSGGQAQRIALCRALLGQPSIVLADEPTGNLDAVNGLVVEEMLLRRAREGCAVVVSTHNTELASRCDRIVAVA
jgi:ABC-type lipoprotein export system ATPase subunit